MLSQVNVRNFDFENFNFLGFVIVIAFIFSIFSRFLPSLSVYTTIFAFFSVIFVSLFNNFKFNLNKYNVFAIVFVLNAIVSYYFADYKYNLRSEIFLLSSGVIIYLLTAFLSLSQKKIIISTQIFIGLWLALYIFAFNLSSGNFFDTNVIPYMNIYVCFLLVSFSLSFVFWNDERKIYKFLPYILFFAILLAKFTIAIIIACLVFATSIFFLKKHKIKTIFSLFFVLISMLYCYWLFKADFFTNKILVWKTALFVVKDNFLIGVGFNNYKTVSSAYSLMKNVDVSSVDNIFLQVLCENGIFGFILFMLVLIVFFYYVLKKIKENKNFYLSILVACISFLVYNFFNSSAFISTNMLLLFFILAVPITQVNDIKERKHKIDSHILIILFLPFVFALGKPVYANEQYKKGLYYFANAKYPVAQDFFIDSIYNDSSNPESLAKLADIYFYKYQKTKKKNFIAIAINLYTRSLSLNKYNSNYYYQLAWLYSFYGNKADVKKYIDKAILMDPFNFLYYQYYDTLINLGAAENV
ncbi:MAG: O-antigen ligase family protein [Endomicrobium sp.]|jgi:tetratricopeptide (TPR) repeat protein|nr:O-antigen ligase family protein [Endomicrobium sp.]